MEVSCDICGKSIDRLPSQVRKNEKHGWKVHCSKECTKHARILEQIPCPVCGKLFAPVRLHHGKRKATCSYSCANTYFRSGADNPTFKGELGNAYRAVCFKAFPHKCAVCDEVNVVEVHHLDKNRSNNTIENLIPLCPTHHKYMHRKQLQPLIADKVIEWQLQKQREEN